MSGFEPRAPLALLRRGHAPAPAALAALDLPDIDAPAGQRQRRPDPAAEAAMRAAEARAAQLATARAEAWAEGEAAGRAAAAAEHAAARATAEATALATAAAALQRIDTEVAATVGEAAAALARLLLAALDAALPAAAARCAPDSAALLAGMMQPVLEEAGRLTLFVAPGFAGPVAARLGDARIAVEEDAALADGDARAAWRGGEAVAALAERRRALAEMLDGLGLGPAPGGQAETGNENT